MLYWNDVDPLIYQKSGNRQHFGKYYFTSASWDSNGTKLMDKNTDPRLLPHEGKTLFILANPEYELHKKLFQKIDTINGRIAQDVFVAAVLLPTK
jgi:hypothetical protein